MFESAFKFKKAQFKVWSCAKLIKTQRTGDALYFDLGMCKQIGVN